MDLVVVKLELLIIFIYRISGTLDLICINFYSGKYLIQPQMGLGIS